MLDDPTHGKYLALRGLKNPFMRIMMMFLDYILARLANFNPLFQSQSPLFHTFKFKTKILVVTPSKNFLDVEYVNGLKNPLDADVNDDNYYVAIQNIYLG